MNPFSKACGLGGPLRLSVEGPGTAAAVPVTLDQPFCVVGQDPAADLKLKHANVHARHAYVQALDGQVYGVDLGSPQGTYWEDARRGAGWIGRGQALRIGPYRLRFESEGMALEQPSPVLEDPTLPRLTLEIMLRGVRSIQTAVTTRLALIGSAADCPVRLLDPSVASFHASLVRTRAGVWVIDLLGQGGVTLNGARVRCAPVHEGDVLLIGRSTLRVRLEASPVVEAPPAPRADRPTLFPFSPRERVAAQRPGEGDPAAGPGSGKRPHPAFDHPLPGGSEGGVIPRCATQVLSGSEENHSLPPCGGGPGWGVGRTEGLDRTRDLTHASVAPPTLALPHKGGGDQKTPPSVLLGGEGNDPLAKVTVGQPPALVPTPPAPPPRPPVLVEPALERLPEPVRTTQPPALPRLPQPVRTTQPPTLPKKKPAPPPEPEPEPEPVETRDRRGSYRYAVSETRAQIAWWEKAPEAKAKATALESCTYSAIMARGPGFKNGMSAARDNTEVRREANSGHETLVSRNSTIILVDVSQSGLSLLGDECPPGGQRVWFRLEGGRTSDWVELIPVGDARTGQGHHFLRFAFRESCPYDLFKTLVFEAKTLRN